MAASNDESAASLVTAPGSETSLPSSSTNEAAQQAVQALLAAMQASADNKAAVFLCARQLGEALGGKHLEEGSDRAIVACIDRAVNEKTFRRDQDAWEKHGAGKMAFYAWKKKVRPHVIALLLIAMEGEGAADGTSEEGAAERAAGGTVLRETEGAAVGSQSASLALRRDLHFPPLRALGKRAVSGAALVGSEAACSDNSVHTKDPLSGLQDGVEDRRLHCLAAASGDATAQLRGPPPLAAPAAGFTAARQ